MAKKKSVLILILVLVLLSSVSTVYGQKGLSWLQETFLPQPKESTLTVRDKTSNGDVILKWETDIKDIDSFVIVASLTNPEPRYPDDGYLCMVDPSLRSHTLDLDLIYQNGDINGSLAVGETYFFSVTAISGSSTYPGNSVTITIPDKEDSPEETAKIPEETDKDDEESKETDPPKTTDPKPKEPVTDPVPKEPAEKVCRAWIKNNIIKMDWTAINDPQLQGYKVVISDTNKSPSYPQDGYLYWITDPSRNYAVVDNTKPYNGGSINGYLEAGKTYYFAVTYVYKDRKVTTPAIKLTTPVDFPIPDSSLEDPEEIACRAWIHSNVIKMDWTKSNDPQFQGYKVVISDTTSSPRYPEDGYLYWITDVSRNYAVIDNANPYNGGSIGGYLQPGKDYYFAVTYVYKDRKATTAAVKLTTPADFPVPETIDYVAPEITTILDEANAVDFNIQIHWTWDGDPTKGFIGFKAEITDMETGAVSYQHLGTTPGYLTLYCDGSGQEPAIVPYRYYKVRIIAKYDSKMVYSDYSRLVRSYGDTE